MGRVRTNLVKKAAKVIIERHFLRLTFDFDTNKKIIEEVADIPSKRLRNKIAGFITHLMKRIERGPVKGISLKLQEEERERRMDFVPERSCLDLDEVEVDADTKDMLRALDFADMQRVVVAAPNTYARKPFGQDRKPFQKRKD
jgi:small subunit ribosomal protein S17e